MMPKINLDYIPPRTRIVLEKLSAKSFIKKFYLAGGTAIALFFGHRRSNDLDFFSINDFNSLLLIRDLKKNGRFENFKQDENTLIGEIDGVKVSFFTVPYGLLEPTAQYKNLAVATLNDLATMKLLAISDRGTKRDFIDLYLLCKRVMPLADFLEMFQKKFGKYDYNIYHVVKSLSYFDDADKEKMPQMYIKLSWGSVKKFFAQEKKWLAKKILGITNI